MKIEGKGKGKQPANSKSKGNTTSGAPSQHSQPSRKGKKAWRKNVDLHDVEQKLDSLRDEERITGGKLHEKSNSELFTIDIVGDEKLRRTLRAVKPLRSTLILSSRSAVPAVFSRPSAEDKHKRVLISRKEKARLLRIGRRKQLGPFNSVVDHTEIGAGSALLEPSEAVKKSGTYDVWMHVDSEDEKIRDKLKTDESKDFIEDLVKKRKIRVPSTSNVRHNIQVSAVSEPHQGASYNPPVSAHQDLLRVAHSVEEKREAEIEKYDGVKKAMAAARVVVGEGGEPVGALGMIVDEPVETEEDAIEGSVGPVTAASTLPRRKTKQQRSRAARVLDEKRAQAERAARKKMVAALHPSNLTRLKKDVAAATSAAAVAVAERRLAQVEKLRAGLAGLRLGKHKVPVGDIDVQLGEDLSESLRQLKTEGNLFRDRFLSLQHRALVEPRVPILPKRRKIKIKEVEKHAWKDFE